MASEIPDASELLRFIGGQQQETEHCKALKQPFRGAIGPNQAERAALAQHTYACVGCQYFLAAYDKLRYKQACDYFRAPFKIGAKATSDDLAALVRHAVTCADCLREGVIHRVAEFGNPL